MVLLYLTVVYLIFTVCNTLMRIIDTVIQERENISRGGSPYGDSTYLVYLLNLAFRVIVGIAICYFLGSYTIPNNNFWLFVLIVLGYYIILELVCATLESIVMYIITVYANKAHKRRLDNRADTLNNELLNRQESGNNDTNNR